MKNDELLYSIEKIYEDIMDHSDKFDSIVKTTHPEYRISAKNLLNYLILRSYDIRNLHDPLSDLGVSSLRSAEGYVLHKISNIINLLKKKKTTKKEKPTDKILNYSHSKTLIQQRANRLLGDSEEDILTKIMVTMPDTIIEDPNLVKDLVKNGMRIARINLSHGNKKIWKAMLSSIYQVSSETDTPIKIFMDLPGPKIRTSPIKIISQSKEEKSFLKVKIGDVIKLNKSLSTTQLLKSDRVDVEGEIGIKSPQIINAIKKGHRVFFDDGHIMGIVIEKKKKYVRVKITKCAKKKLKSNKGINLPDTSLSHKALTKEDKSLLPFMAKHADILGYSFVQTVDDIDNLYEYLDFLGKEDLGVVLKIETKEAFNKLPLLLLRSMQRNNVGVMIARGDLAVEIGYDRISEVQDQIMWLCEAAHIPVIWATQVLETYAKTGVPTRAEISDAALSVKAECVMLNKGPHISDAVVMLKNILKRMEAHSSKKKDALRSLKVAKSTLKILST